MRLIQIVVFYFCFRIAAAADAPASTETIAKAFRFPPDQLIVTDLTENLQSRRGGERVLSAYRYTSTNNSFAPVSVVIAEQGSLLTDDLQKKIADYKTKTDQERYKRLAEINVEDKAFGFCGLGALGPGGASEQVLLNIPSLKLDVQITKTIPSESPIIQTLANKQYHELVIYGDGKMLTELIVECAKGIVREVIEEREASKMRSNGKTATTGSNDENSDSIVELRSPQSDDYKIEPPQSDSDGNHTASILHRTLLSIPIVTIGIVVVILILKRRRWR